MLDSEVPLSKRTNTLFMGTHVTSGSARAVAVLTGRETEFGKVSETLRLRPVETEFERGIRQFGYLLTEVTFALVLVIFGVSVFIDRPLLDSFLFALALAVGLIPELLPAIISFNLSIGAVRMARRKVIVKQLAAIENFGSMNILCSDFDFLTFGALLFILKATPAQFRTGWFLESLITELLIVPVIRTQRGLLRSRPGRALLIATVGVFGAALILPYTPLSGPLGFTPLPLSFVLLLLAITGLYIIASEVTKRYFYKMIQSR